MLSFLLRLGENRVEQLEKQDILDKQLRLITKMALNIVPVLMMKRVQQVSFI